jgi:Fe-S cluster assembly protein SufD
MTTIDMQPNLLTGFDEFLDGRHAEPAWRRDAREAAVELFRHEGLPTTRDEEWLYTPVSAIADAGYGLAAHEQVPPADVAPFLFADFPGPQLVFVNGKFWPALSDLRPLPPGARVVSLAELQETDADFLQQHLGRGIQFRQRGFTALNEAWNTDGAVLVVEADVEIQTPVHVLYYSSGTGAAHPRTLLVVGRHAKVSVVESFAGAADTPYFVNAVTEVLVDEGGHVDHYKVQRESAKAHHIASMHLHLAKAADVATHNISLGGALTRNDINATLDGEGIECTVNGLYLVDGDRLVDNHTAIDHAKPHCHSYEIYKGVLDDRGRGVFNGKIFVREDAQKTDAKQTNQVLLLSDDATIDTKPQLEIFADDVKCTHGATVGQLSDEALFYLRARGIARDDARALLVHAFAEDIVDRIRIDAVRHALEQVLLARLPIRDR